MDRTKSKRFMRIGIAAVGFACSIVAFRILELAFINGGYLTMLDLWISRFFASVRTSNILLLAYVITFLANPEFVLAVGIFLALYFYWNLREPRFVLGLFTSVGLTHILSLALKLEFLRERPIGILPYLIESTSSFPSGHATAAAAFYGYITYVIMLQTQSKTARIVSVLSLLGIILLIDLSRMALGVHFLTDVLAGNFLGCIGLFIAIILTEVLVKNPRGKIHK